MCTFLSSVLLFSKHTMVQMRFGQQVDTVLSHRVRIGIPGSGYPDKNDLMGVFSSSKGYSISKTIHMDGVY